jgi:hypothetical protein
MSHTIPTSLRTLSVDDLTRITTDKKLITSLIKVIVLVVVWLYFIYALGINQRLNYSNFIATF